MAKATAPKILVVDDEKEIRDITEAFLMLNGYEVTTAENGKVALETFLSNHYDVVITDLQMPQMGGMELLEKISQSKSDAITILLTGYAIKQADITVETFANLQKPFSHNQLIQVVEKGLENHGLK